MAHFIQIAAYIASVPLAPEAHRQQPDALSQKRLLEQILPKLKRTLSDPYSVRDFSICEPMGLKMKDGRPDRWTVLISFNARNAYGGYTGLSTWMAIFRKGRLSGDLVQTQIQSTDGLMGLMNRPMQEKIERCASIADDELQRLMAQRGGER